MICKFQSIYCSNNNSVKSNDILRLIVATFICTHFDTWRNAFRYVQMHFIRSKCIQTSWCWMKILLGHHKMHFDATKCIWKWFAFRKLAWSSRNAFRVDDCPPNAFCSSRDAFGDLRSPNAFRRTQMHLGTKRIWGVTHCCREAPDWKHFHFTMIRIRSNRHHNKVNT
jgi:hypothetical protein